MNCRFYLSADGLLMPARKDQALPELLQAGGGIAINPSWRA